MIKTCRTPPSKLIVDAHQSEYPKNCVTDISKFTSFESDTEKFSISGIVLPSCNDNNGSSIKLIVPFSVLRSEGQNASTTFGYEQQRLKELGENVKKFNDTAPHSEVDPEDPRLGKLINHHRAVIEDEDTLIENWTIMVKLAAIAVLGVSSIMVLFSIIFVVVEVLKVITDLFQCIVPTAISVVENTLMIYLAIVGFRTSAIIDAESPAFLYFFRFSVTSLIIFALQFGAMSVLKSVPEIFASLRLISSNEEADKSKGFFAVSYFVLWSLSIMDIFIVGLLITFVVLMRRHMRIRTIYVLQYNTLPLGYQMFAQFSKDNP